MKNDLYIKRKRSVYKLKLIYIYIAIETLSKQIPTTKSPIHEHFYVENLFPSIAYLE